MSSENLDILKNLGGDGRYQSGCYRRVSWSQLAFVCSETNFFLGSTKVRQWQPFA